MSEPRLVGEIIADILKNIGIESEDNGTSTKETQENGQPDDNNQSHR